MKNLFLFGKKLWKYTFTRICYNFNGKGKLPKIIKLLLYLFSYYQFNKKLQFKCKEYGTNIVIVDESYTSKTCTNYGNLHKTLGSNKTYTCEKCNIVIDRDVNGARNILLKNYKLIELKIKK